MDNIEIVVKTLKKICPNSKWKIFGDTYEDIEWLSESEYIPTKEEFDSEVFLTKKEFEETEYQRLRAPEYPSITDLADALYWNSKGDPSHLEEYYSACEAVKDKYPKP